MGCEQRIQRGGTCCHQSSGVTVPKLRDFYSRFPEQNLDSAIGGCIMEMQQGLKQAQSIEDQKSQDATEPEA